MTTEEASVQCPWCWEYITVLVDPSAGDQAYVEDCSVCCRPIELSVAVATDGTVTVGAGREE